MPIYEYLCQSCGKKFEVLQRFSDAPLLIHPDCGGNLEKLISTSALQFKGSGWYVNDYAKGAASKPGDTKAEAKSEKSQSEGSKSDGAGESKSESKAETKTESKPAASETKPSTPGAPAAATQPNRD